MRVDFSTGIAIPPCRWDAEAQSILPGHNLPNGTKPEDANDQLTALRAILTHEVKAFALREGQPPTPAEFRASILTKATLREPNKASRKALKREQTRHAIQTHPTRRAASAPLSPTSAGSILGYYDTFIKDQGNYNSWAKATYKKFWTTRNYIVAYMRAHNSRLSLDGFDFDAFQGLKEFVEVEYNLASTSVQKLLKCMRWFLRWAFRKGYYHGNAHETYKPRLVGLTAREVIFLTWEELMQFWHFEFRPEAGYLRRVRDVFCFCCFTGLRYSDVAALKVADVHAEDDAPHIETLTQKTNDRLRIELNKYSLTILLRYIDGKTPRDPALPVPSNQRMNSYLHQAAREAGLDAPTRTVIFRRGKRQEEVLPKWAVLTSHAGRRTFIVTALRLGIPAPVIMEWTGHSDYDAMKPYIKIVDEAKKANMSLFDSLPETE